MSRTQFSHWTRIGDKYILGFELGRGAFRITYLCTNRETKEALACSVSRSRIPMVDIEAHGGDNVDINGGFDSGDNFLVVIGHFDERERERCPVEAIMVGDGEKITHLYLNIYIYIFNY